jgi:GT2 family glycosyltransferase
VEGWPVIVVDDTDDGLDLDVPRVRLGGGQGFAKAANRGLAAVRTPTAVVLNDDAAPERGCLARLATVGGVCGPVLVGPRGVESAGIRVRSWGRVTQRTALPPADTRVDALSGACLHLPAGLRFDERFRHGGEDVELCRRVGGGTLVVGARCWHEGGATLDRRSEEAQRHAIAGQLRLVPAGWRDAVVIGLHVAQVAREGGPARRLRGVRDGWRDARRG